MKRTIKVDGVLGEDVFINADINFTSPVPEPDVAYADDEPFMTFRFARYNPDKLAKAEVIADGVDVTFTLDQDQFINLVRYLNNQKNKLLKMRKEMRDYQDHKKEWKAAIQQWRHSKKNEQEGE